MPVTRSEGKGRRPATEQKPSSSESTAHASATGTSAETGDSTATGTTTTEYTEETGTTEYTEVTATTEETVTSATTAPSSSPSAPAAPPSVTPSAAPTMQADANKKMMPPAAVSATAVRKKAQQHTETSTIKMKRRAPGLQEPNQQKGSRPPTKKGGGGESTHSKSKAHRIAKAKEELLRLQIELAAAKIAALETEDTEDEEDEEVSVYSKTETNRKVDNWLENQVVQPVLAITNEPHQPPEEDRRYTEDNRKHTEDIRRRTENDRRYTEDVGRCTEDHRKNTEDIRRCTEEPRQAQQTPAGAQNDLTGLAEAITRAVKAAQRPKFIELPYFGGSHQEWLPFRAAYYETEAMFSAVENTNRLRRNLKGKAKEAVEGLLITSAHPTEVMKTLESRFGRPESIAMMEMEALRGLPRLTESPREICIFATKVSNIVATLKTLGCMNYMYNPEIAKTVVDKLTPTLRYRYYDFTALQPREDPDLLKLEKFLKREADLCGPYALPEQVATAHAPVTVQKRTQKINNVVEKTYTPKCPVCEQGGHSSPDCEEFKKLNENGRWDMAKARRLCFRCLRYRSKTHNCKAKPCGISGCKYFHHRMLHYNKKTEEASIEHKASTENINSAWTTTKKQSYLKIMPVKVTGPAGKIDTFALLDDGSTVTLIDDHIADKVGLQGPVDPLRIEAINEMKTAETASRRVSLTLRGPNNREERIQARTVRNLRVSPQEVTKQQLLECEHLRDMQDILAYANAKPGILIGQDNWHLLLATKTKKGNKNQPVASLTPLGWVLHGSYTRTLGRDFHRVHHLAEQEKEDELHEMMKQYFAMDALCITPKKPQSDPEEQALRILEKNTSRTEDGRFQTGLLWRKEDVVFPNNYENSLKRLINIEKKIDRDPALKIKYTEQMEALVVKGYAEPAPEQKNPGKTWYLPHFAVINPMKPDKLRVVHDAAAKTRGVALNDMLLKGPDLLQSLPGVVMRFRQHNIAVTADIKEMFMQVKLRTEDRDALRYLWRGDRRDNQPPQEYRMTSLIFGASSSPSTAIYIKNLNAKQHEGEHPEAASAIVNKHYVDDYLDSFRSLEDAERITRSVREVHMKAKFELKQWKSNSTALIEALGEQEETETTELYKSEEKTERVLGLMWNPKTDEIGFNLNLVKIPTALVEGKTPTKREALRIVMSLFDPLGFASPVTIRAKQILQEVWRRGTDWDDEIEADLATHWKEWMTHLKRLRNVTIPRKYLHYSDARSLQLHVFTDASEASYAAVLFWRAVAPDGEVSVSLVLAKAKVTPLKITSIPRLELQAAVMGARLAEVVIEEHERKPDSKTFWTDSKTALTWIRTGSRSYKPYVAHRIAAIEEVSTVSEWRWLSTKLNVADDATRDVPVNFGKEHRWYKGPDFLYEDESTWPEEQKTSALVETTGEERVNHVSINSNRTRLSEGLPDVSRFSSWNRLRYTTARVLMFIQMCRPAKQQVNYKRTTRNRTADPDWRRVNKPSQPKLQQKKTEKKVDRRYLPVSAELLIEAEKLLIRSSQEDSFSQEIEDLRKQKQINKESRLHNLSVEYVEDTLRLRSRIEAAKEITEEVRRPMIVDGNHPTVKLWICHIHRLMHHAGVEATVNECRQQYWILRLRPITRSILKQCLHCRMKTQVPPYPRTGDLPLCRLAHHKRPFTYTGVDYFGPLTVTVGRSNQKRYVAIFTCLTTRAIHLEIAATLSTDSAIMALRRMIARRGCPTQIWSDNGTNLKGADKELRQAIDSATAEEAAKKTISWRFIPPGAPFMGGAWERMVRSVKTALTSTLHERHPTEEVFTTLLAEAEYTVNSRPLTHVSVSEEDPEALTPNHFLIGGPGRVPQPGTFNEKDTITKTSWRAAQRLADIFWTRWLREYLPELQHRREPAGRGPEVTTGDLVQLIDTNLPRNVWIRGIVTATYPGPDGIVRTVDIKTKGGVLRRPVRKLVILPLRDVAPAPGPAVPETHGGSNVQDDVIV